MLQPVHQATTSRYRERVLPVLIHVEEHLDEPLTLGVLAAIAGFSVHHFHRIFQQVTGEAPKEYLRRLRLERAVLRLKVSPDNVLPIALEAGFATHETFTRAFIRQFGISPSEFRRVLREFRAAVDDRMETRTYAGHTDDTPLILRFDMQKEPVSVEQTPPRHLIFVRHTGYENLPADRGSFIGLWDELFAYADAQGLEYSRDQLVGITHDDPYVTDEHRTRFDACLPIGRAIPGSHLIGYRYQRPGLSVVRRHMGGTEEIAKTFAYVGVDWLPSDDYGIRAAAPFEVYHPAQGFTDAYVPLEPTKHRQGER